MKKEIIVAIMLGLGIGLIVTYGFYRSQNFDSAKQIATLESDSSPSPASEVISNLVIHAPKDESIVSESEVTITGSVDVQSFVVIFVNENEYLTETDEAGNFSLVTELEAGSNIITVYAINEDGQKSVQESIVIFTDQPLEPTTDETENDQDESSQTEDEE